jgi:transforming growth factor-beta-induced protein
MTSKTVRFAGALMSLTLVAAACGSDDNDTPVATEAPVATAAAEEPGTIVDVAVANGSFTTLVAAVQAADLVETLSGEGPFTVFAPTDEAFAAALTALGLTAEELLADTELLTSVLTYHVVPGAVMAETVLTLDGQSVATVNGAEVTIGVDGDAVTVNDANVVAVDVAASNGVIHVIDAVLLPPA